MPRVNGYSPGASMSGCRSMSRVATTGTSMPAGVLAASSLAPFAPIVLIAVLPRYRSRASSRSAAAQ